MQKGQRHFPASVPTTSRDRSVDVDGVHFCSFLAPRCSVQKILRLSWKQNHPPTPSPTIFELDFPCADMLSVFWRKTHGLTRMTLVVQIHLCLLRLHTAIWACLNGIIWLQPIDFSKPPIVIHSQVESPELKHYGVMIKQMKPDNFGVWKSEKQFCTKL